MRAAYEQLLQVLEEQDISYQSDEASYSIYADLRGDVGCFRILAQIDEESDSFQVFGLVPICVPVGCRPSVGEAVLRANYGLPHGKFELDLDRGQLHFHASHVLLGNVIGEDVIERMINVAMGMLDQYVPAFLSVIYGNEEPKAAIACAEAAHRCDEWTLGGDDHGEE